MKSILKGIENEIRKKENKKNKENKESCDKKDPKNWWIIRK